MLKWFEKNHRLSWIMTFLIAIAIFYVSSLSFQGGSGPDFPLKPIIYHFSIFFILAFFMSISLLKGKKENMNLILVVLLIGILYGISDEFHQLFVPNRVCDIKDALIDSAGILCSCILYTIRLKKK